MMHGGTMNALQGAFGQGGWAALLNALRHGHMGGPVMGGGPIPGQPAPNTQFPLNPGMGGPIQGQQMPGMVGTSLGVNGAVPAASPFELPRY
jgi:hypothetical protein